MSTHFIPPSASAAAAVAVSKPLQLASEKFVSVAQGGVRFVFTRREADEKEGTVLSTKKQWENAVRRGLPCVDFNLDHKLANFQVIEILNSNPLNLLPVISTLINAYLGHF